MDPIYRQKTYQFEVAITVSGVAVDITPDTVTAILDKGLNVDAPAISVEADVTTKGASGIAVFEFEPDDTDVEAGVYNLQVVWEIFGTTREFVVYTDRVSISNTVAKPVEP